MRRTKHWLYMGIWLAISLLPGSGLTQAHLDTPARFPLTVSKNHRYLVDSAKRPFLITGDAPQALMVNLNEDDASLYLSNRVSLGFNTVWINLLCNDYTGGRKDGSTFDGVLPFTPPGDLASPNDAYFARCDRMLAIAAKQNLLVLLDPIETGGWLPIMVKSGPEKCRAFGRYVAKRYSGYKNIVWMSGNDFQNWRDKTNDAAVAAVALGIRDIEPKRIQTIELDYLISASMDDPTWAAIVSLNAAYTYYPTYAKVLAEYNNHPNTPVFMVEADYELENGATPAALRRQEYWSLLSGACGQVYGNGAIWPFKPDWKGQLHSQGATEVSYLASLFGSRPWYNLIPDQSHLLLVDGYGKYDASNSEANRHKAAGDYATAAITSDGKLAIIYLAGSARPIKVDMRKMSGAVTAHWFDPTNGVESQAGTAVFSNQADHVFVPPTKNHAGDSDSVLILEVLKGTRSSAPQ